MFSPVSLLLLASSAFIIVLTSVALPRLIHPESITPDSSRRLALLSALGMFSAVFLTGTALLAADAAPAPAEVSLFERLFSYVGMAAAGLSAVATILPRSWRVTQLAARFSADLRGILTPDTADDPSWSRSTRDTRP